MPILSRPLVRIRPSVSYWCPLERKFKFGPSWLSYHQGIQYLRPGFEVIWNGNICTFSNNPNCWKNGTETITIEDFGIALTTANPDHSIEAALRDAAIHPAPEQLNVKDYLRLPITSAQLLLRLDALCRIGNRPHSYPISECKLDSQKPRRIFAWRFDGDIVEEDDLQRVVLLVERVVTGCSYGQPILSWEREESLHTEAKSLLLSFWARCGGRDKAICAHGGRLGAYSQYLVHSIRSIRTDGIKRKCLVEWVGYHDCTWEDEANINPELLVEFIKN